MVILKQKVPLSKEKIGLLVLWTLTTQRTHEEYSYMDSATIMSSTLPLWSSTIQSKKLGVTSTILYLEPCQFNEQLYSRYYQWSWHCYYATMYCLINFNKCFYVISFNECFSFRPLINRYSDKKKREFKGKDSTF